MLDNASDILLNNSVSNDNVVVTLVHKQLDKTYLTSPEGQYWALERDFRDSSYYKMLELSFQFLKSMRRVQWCS